MLPIGLSGVFNSFSAFSGKSLSDKQAEDILAFFHGFFLLYGSLFLVEGALDLQF